MSALYIVDNVRVLYATAKKEYATDTSDKDCSTTSWVINPEAGDTEPQIYTYVEKSDTIADSAVKSNNDMEALIKDGRRFRMLLARTTGNMTISSYNQSIKDVLEDVAAVIAGYTQVTRDVDGVQKVLGCLPMDSIHSLDRVFCASPALDMYAYTYAPDPVAGPAKQDAVEGGEEAEASADSAGDSSNSQPNS